MLIATKSVMNHFYWERKNEPRILTKVDDINYFD